MCEVRDRRLSQARDEAPDPVRGIDAFIERRDQGDADAIRPWIPARDRAREKAPGEHGDMLGGIESGREFGVRDGCLGPEIEARPRGRYRQAVPEDLEDGTELLAIALAILPDMGLVAPSARLAC